MKKLIHFIDPYHQSPFYFKWDFFDWFVIVVITGFLFAHCHQMLLLIIFYNPIVSYPNLYLHSLFGHVLLGPLLEGTVGSWLYSIFHTMAPSQLLGAASGFLAELFFPCGALLWCVRLPGGRFVLPFALYWLSICVFGIGNYMKDATEGYELDLMPYDGLGDWNVIFDNLGLLPFCSLIGNIVIFLSIMCFVVAVWSFFYYWIHIREYDHRNGDYH